MKLRHSDVRSQILVTHAILTAPNPTLIRKIMLYSESTFFFVHFEGESFISTYNVFFETIIFRETAPTPPPRHFGIAGIASCLRFNSQLLPVMHLVP